MIDPSRIKGTPIGRGIPRSRPRITARPQEISLDLPDEWVDSPTIPNQLMQGPKMARPKSCAVKVFNLGNTEQQQEYEQLLASAMSPATNLVIAQDDIRFHEASGTWRALVKVIVYEFRKILSKENPNEH